MDNNYIFGYARVSTDLQHIDNQIDELIRRGVKSENIYTDVYSGAKKLDNRAQFKQLLGKLRRGDTLMVFSIDRLSRRIRDILDITDQLEETGVKLIITSMDLDLTTPYGKLILHQFAALAQFELEQIKIRQRLGIDRAKKEGKYKGRKSKLSDLTRQTILDLNKQGYSNRKIAEVVKLGKSTVQRIIAKEVTRV